jgi:ATP/maltotriose-dependent transcriptional regulator MalT
VHELLGALGRALDQPNCSHMEEGESFSSDYLFEEEYFALRNTAIPLNRGVGGRGQSLLNRTMSRSSRPESRRRAIPSVRSQLVTLPPSLRRVCDALLTGASEKQVAEQLGLSPHTVHDYVKLLYKLFQVHSRAELMAKLLGSR